MLPPFQVEELRRRSDPYLGFRDEVEEFQNEFLSGVCTRKCFSSRASDCCNRDGIAVFFADVVVECLYADDERIDLLCRTLEQDRGGFKCAYLGPEGCLWRIKPIVCEMFLCDHAMKSVLDPDPLLRGRWEDLRSRERQYTWPDRPVLFDELEGVFLQAGHESPLMYFHRSPGLLRVKARSMPRS